MRLRQLPTGLIFPSRGRRRWRPPVRQSVTRLPSVGSGDSTWIAKHHDFLKATATSPPHPQSQRLEVGLHKISLGVLPFPRDLEKWPGLDGLSLKLWSTRPVQRQHVSRALYFALRSSYPPKDLRSWLGQTFGIVFNIWSKSKLIRDVFFQTHHSPARRNILGIGSRSLHPRERRWNLYSEMCRENHSAAVSSKVWMVLTTNSLHLTNWCQLSNRVLPTGLLTLKVGFHLRPEVQEPELQNVTMTTSENLAYPDGPIQRLVDGMLEQVVFRLMKRIFEDIHELISSIKKAVLQHLRSSYLAAMVEFHNLDVEIANTGTGTQRFTSSTLLNSDGSEKVLSGPEMQDSQDPMTWDEPADMQMAAAAEEPNFGNPSPFTFTLVSNTVREKTGIASWRVALLIPNTSARTPSLPSVADLLRDFTRLCESTDSTGLLCCAAVGEALSIRYPHVYTVISSNQAIIETHVDENAGQSNTFGLQISLSGQSPRIMIKIPRIKGLEYSVNGDSGRPRRLETCQVHLHSTYRKTAPAEHADTQPRLSTKDEVRILTQMTSTIVETILAEMKFDSNDAVPPTLAEGILRTLQFPTSGLVLHKVKVDVTLPQDSSSGPILLKGAKSSEQAGLFGLDRAESDVGSSDELLDTFQTHLREPSTWMEEESLKSSSLADSVSLASVDSEEISSRHKTDETASIELRRSNTPHGIYPYLSPNLVSIGAHEISIPQALEQKLGIFKLTFHVDWEPEHHSSVSNLTATDICARILQELEKSPATTLTNVQTAVGKVSEALPHHPNIRLSVRKHLPRGHSIMHFKCRRIESTGAWEGTVRVILPSIFCEEFRIKEASISSESRLALYTILDGVISGHEKESTDGGLTYDITKSCTDLDDIIRPMLEKTVFDSLHDLTETSLSVFLTQRQILEEIMNVCEITVNTRILEEQNKIVEQEQASARMPSGTETSDEPDSTPPRPSIPEKSVFVALGSNVGDRLENIEKACAEMDAEPEIRIRRTSCLYETKPMYVEEQGHFLNGACEIETSLEPTSLLDKLQAIEQRLGRVKTVDKGPRNIDLDILLYRGEQIRSERLTVPHPLMMEREFVLRPLSDISTAEQTEKPAGRESYVQALQKLRPSPEPMFALTPLGPGSGDLRANDSCRRTRIMSILNVTPDSFSDGGLYDTMDAEKLTSVLKAQIEAGATLIDIGGQSSRPNAPDVTAEEEIARVLPAIKAIKSLPEAAEVAISVDTYRAAVAKAAIEAGAHIINDISAGLLDADMLPTVAKLGCTYIMMHMRGTPSTMQNEENLSYPNGLIPTIAAELQARIDAAQMAGIRRWRIILDPGIGFSKTPDQNLEILRNFPELRASPGLQNYPWLAGSSRKSFIGKITGTQDPKERVWGTTATVTAAIQGGADIVRVHDVAQMADVVTMADAMYRV